MLLPERGVATALLDTGSDINLVAQELLDADDEIRPTETTITLASADHTAQIIGIVTLTIVIKGETFIDTFHVLPRLRHNIIIGNAFFKKHRASMCYSRRCISMGTKRRVIAYWNQVQRPQLEDVHLPQFEEDIPDQIKEIYQEFEDLFQVGLRQSTTISTLHRIPLKKDKVIHRRAYPMPPSKKQILHEQIQEMLRAGVIEPSTSPYSSPPVLVMRPDKKPRFCVDYRELNEITEDEATALPKISDALKGLAAATIFTVLDLKSGYWQIPLAPEDAEKTAFTTPDGTAYQFRVMPFGLKNAPGTFQRLMAGEVLTGLLHRCCCVYLDDVIIYSRSMEEHARHTHLVLERLREHELRISAEKCQIAKTGLDYLGFTLDGGLVKPQEKHLRQVEGFAAPKNRRQLQGFLGTCGWLREHVPRYSEITAPLTELLKGPAKGWKWGQAESKAFEATKRAVAESKPLHRPDFAKRFVLQTDASMEGMAAVLYQEEGGDRKIISYASAKFKPAERRLHVNEQECLALVWAVGHYRPYLEEQPFTVRTDSRCLTWLGKFKDSRAKLTRWALLLQEFSFTLEHVKGKENQLPDLLSRLPEEADYEPEPDNERLLPPSGPEVEEGEPATCNTEMNSEEVTVSAVALDELYEKVARAQLRSDFYPTTVRIIQALKQAPELGPVQERMLREFEATDGLLWRRNPAGDRLAVPKSMVPAVIHRFHDEDDLAHPGTAETIRRISEKFFFGHMGPTVKNYVRKCVVCGIAKTQQRQRNAPQRPRSPKYPWEMISIDVLGPYPEAVRTKNRFILVVEDVFTKWVEAFSGNKFEAKDLARILETEIFPRYGTPKYLVSDNGPIFISNRIERMCERFGITQLHSAVWHQRANPVERRCQELKKVLRVLLVGKEPNQWEKQLIPTVQVLRSRLNRATGYSPASLVLGYELPMPGEWKTQWTRYRRPHRTPNQRRRRNRKVFARQLNFQNKEFPRREEAPPIRFTLGQRVNLRNRAPGVLVNPWVGPGVVTRIVSDTTYEVEFEGHAYVHHLDDLRPAPEGNIVEYDPVEEVPVSESESSEEDREFEEPEDLRRIADSNEELDTGDEAVPQENPAATVNAAVIDRSESWNWQKPSTLKDTCLEAQRLADRINKEIRQEEAVYGLYDELVTKLAIHLDSFELRGSSTLRAARKQAIGRLELALVGLRSRIDPQ